MIDKETALESIESKLNGAVGRLIVTAMSGKNAEVREAFDLLIEVGGELSDFWNQYCGVMSVKGFLKNCVTIPREGYSEPLIQISEDGTITPHLEGYTILPNEQFEALTAERDALREALEVVACKSVDNVYRYAARVLKEQTNQ